MSTHLYATGSRSRLAQQPAPDTAWPTQLLHTWRARQRCRAPLSRQQASSNIGIGALDSGDEQPRASPVNYAPKDRKQLWKAAIKLPMYSVGVVPVLVGAAAAYLEHSMMPWTRVAALLVGSICVIAWLNLRWVLTARTLMVSRLPRSLLSVASNTSGRVGVPFLHCNMCDFGVPLCLQQ